MMMALMMAAQAVAPVSPVQPTLPPPPANWQALPAIPWKTAPHLDGISDFVMDEVAAGRCRAEQSGRTAIVRLDLAVLADGSGQVRRIVPRAIGCPTVEQYGSGLVSRWARDNLSPMGSGDSWYRATVTFAWAG